MNFTDFEKRIIKKISEINPEDASIFGDYIASEFFKSKQLALLLLHEYKSYNLFHKVDSKSSIRKEYSRISQLLSLLHYLEINRYIYILPVTLPKSNVDLFYEDKGDTMHIDAEDYRIYINQTKDKYITIPHNFENKSFLLDAGNTVMQGFTFTKELYERFVHFFNSVIYPTSSLKELVKNNYVSENEHRFNLSMENAQKQLEEARQSVKMSKRALCIAILVAILSPILSVWISNQWGVVTIDECQFEQIIEALLNLN